MKQIKAIAPSGKINKEKFAEGQANLELLFDCNVFNDACVFDTKRNMAGSDDIRLSDFLTALKNPKVDIAWAIRGGFGATRLLGKLPKDLSIEPSKLLIGYSDITALQWACFKLYGLQGISGHLMQVDFDDKIGKLDEYAILFSLIQEENPQFAMPQQCYFENFKNLQGVTLGGCLSIICKLLGTPYMPDLEDKILFLEDLNEEIYKLDGLFAHLKNAGVLQQVQGVVLGQFTAPSSVAKEQYQTELKELFEEYFFCLQKPVIWNFPIGHIDHIFPLPIGFNAQISKECLSFSR